MQVTGLSSLAFAGVPANEMSSANTRFSTSLQLACGLGVTMGALSIRAGGLLTDWLGYEDVQGMAFKLGFVIIALITAVGSYDMTRLEASAGNNISRKA